MRGAHPVCHQGCRSRSSCRACRAPRVVGELAQDVGSWASGILEAWLCTAHPRTRSDGSYSTKGSTAHTAHSVTEHLWRYSSTPPTPAGMHTVLLGSSLPFVCGESEGKVRVGSVLRIWNGISNTSDTELSANMLVESVVRLVQRSHNAVSS